MKDIKQKIKDCIFTEFNQELIGDKIKLQNKVNKYQRMIDMIDYLQPVQDTEVDDFVLPYKYKVRAYTKKQQKLINKFASKLKGGEHWGSGNCAESNYLCIEGGKYRFGKFFHNYIQCQEFTEITFEQFKKYVLNK